MTDEDVRRHLESLLREYGEMSKLQARHDERIMKAAKERDEIRDSIEKLESELLAAIARSEQRTRELVTSVKASCDKGWDDMAAWVKKYEEGEKVKRDRDSDRAERSLMSRRQVTIGVIALVLTALGMIMTLLIVLLGGGT